MSAQIEEKVCVNTPYVFLINLIFFIHLVIVIFSIDIYFYCNIRYVILSDAFNKDVIIIIIKDVIKDVIKDCTICHDYAPAQQKEPSIPSPIPDLPWAMGASNIFIFESEQFLVLVDYYVKYIEVTKLKDLTSQETIQALE